MLVPLHICLFPFIFLPFSCSYHLSSPCLLPLPLRPPVFLLSNATLKYSQHAHSKCSLHGCTFRRAGSMGMRHRTIFYHNKALLTIPEVSNLLVIFQD
ncbi:hypothetical protein EDB19DRAFT_1748500 [Suillus lakei]|nr:hypothetical protein EDB19DRAFT_1748500 [Suillus lakei]